MQNIAQYIDQTLLLQDATKNDIVKFCKEAKKYGFYAVCIQPVQVATAAEVLKNSEIKIAAVVGFPCGSTFTEIKEHEAKLCLENGADEIDMVMNIGALKERDLDTVKTDIEKLSSLTKVNNALLKVIIETGLLTDEEKILACQISAEAGADFVKTSTGFTKNSKPATVEDVKLMYDIVKDKGVKVKASGGIKGYATAKAMIEAGASRLGTSSGVEIVEGLSSTADY